MLTLVRLSANAFTTASLAFLATLAALHELVLICPDRTAVDAVPALRGMLGHQQVVTLLVGNEVSREERTLIAELLDEGKVPLVLTVGDPASSRAANWLWLGAQASIEIPAA